MVGYLKRPKSTSERFAEAFALAGQALPKGFEDLEKGREKKQKAISKNLGNLSKYLPQELKSRGLNTYINSDDLSDLREKMRPLIESGMEPYEAFEKVFPEHAKGKTKQDEKDSSLSGIMSGMLGGTGMPLLKKLMEGGNLKKPTEPFSKEKALKLLGSGFDPSVEAIKNVPGRSAGAAALGQVSPWEEAAQFFSNPDRLAASIVFGKPQPKNLSETIREKLSEGLPEKQKKGLTDIEALSSIFNIPAAAAERLLAKGSQIAKALVPSEILPPEVSPPASLGRSKRLPYTQPPELTFQEGKGTPPGTPPSSSSAQETPKGMIQNVDKSAERPQTATEMRVKRMTPESRIYPRMQNIQIREQQIKNFPRYIEEIEADAIKREQQAEARIPKTVKGMDSQKIRRHEAQKALPEAVDNYDKSVARVRALEDEMAKLVGNERTQLNHLVQTATKELEETSFNLKQAMENLKGMSYRAEIGEMREAAQKKLLEIQDIIASGEPYELAKRDYSPDLIAEAKRIKKKKALPYSPKDDFYNQVHEVYANEYRNRLAQLDNQIAELAKDKSMASLAYRQQLGKERDIIKKMIESAEAERTIHKHKFGLRQMRARQQAKERIAKFKKIQANPQVQKEQSLAQQKMWKQRIQEAKSPEVRAQVIDEALGEIIASDPKNAEAIQKEARGFKAAAEDFIGFKERVAQESPSGAGARMEVPRTEAAAPPPSPKQPPKRPSQPTMPGGEPLPKGAELFKGKTSKEAVKQAKSYWDKFMSQWDDLKKSFPFIWKSKMGKDILIGIGTAAWDEFKKEYDIPISAGTMASVALGRPSGAPLRYFTNQMVKWGLKKWRLANAVEAVKSHDEKKFAKYSPAIRKEAIKKASQR